MKRKSLNTILLLTLATAFFIVLAIFGYFRTIDVQYDFDLSKSTKHKTTYRDTIKIGVVSRFTPRKIYDGYQPLMDYLTHKTGILFELKLSSSYSEALRQLENGEVSAAFLGSYIFAKEMSENLQAVLKPLNDEGKPFFRSALIVKDNSNIYRVEDLRNKKVALPSAEAFSGNWLQMILLKKFGLTENDLKEIKHFAFHNSVVRQVLMGNYDAGVVKDRVAREYAKSGIRTVIYSEPIPGSPLVISKKSEKQKVEILVRALLGINKDDTTKKNWDAEFIYGFTHTKNSDYEPLRKLILGAQR